MPLPVVENRTYLQDAFIELGKVTANGMTVLPLPFSEIAAYSQMTPGFERKELMCLRSMSNEYVTGLNMTDPFDLAPWSSGNG